MHVFRGGACCHEMGGAGGCGQGLWAMSVVASPWGMIHAGRDGHTDCIISDRVATQSWHQWIAIHTVAVSRWCKTFSHMKQVMGYLKEVIGEDSQIRSP